VTVNSCNNDYIVVVINNTYYTVRARSKTCLQYCSDATEKLPNLKDGG